jgi:hypothetical protein
VNGSSVGVASKQASRLRTDFFGVKAVPRTGLVSESERALGPGCLVQWAGARRDVFADHGDRGVGDILRHVHWQGDISGLGVRMGAGQLGVTREPSKRRQESGGCSQTAVDASTPALLGVEAARSAGDQVSRDNEERQSNNGLQPAIGALSSGTSCLARRLRADRG